MTIDIWNIQNDNEIKPTKIEVFQKLLSEDYPYKLIIQKKDTNNTLVIFDSLNIKDSIGIFKNDYVEIKYGKKTGKIISMRIFKLKDNFKEEYKEIFEKNLNSKRYYNNIAFGKEVSYKLLKEITNCRI